MLATSTTKNARNATQAIATWKYTMRAASPITASGCATNSTPHSNAASISRLANPSARVTADGPGIGVARRCVVGVVG